mgnify:CR=1 FL=1
MNASLFRDAARIICTCLGGQAAIDFFARQAAFLTREVQNGQRVASSGMA